jgi:hypothetical protein
MSVTDFPFIMAAILAGMFSEDFLGVLLVGGLIPPAHRLSGCLALTRTHQKTVRRPGCLTPAISGLLHFAPLRGQQRLAPAVDPLQCRSVPQP